MKIEILLSKLAISPSSEDEPDLEAFCRSWVFGELGAGAGIAQPVDVAQMMDVGMPSGKARAHQEGLQDGYEGARSRLYTDVFRCTMILQDGLV